jgi:hypothetical protein
VAVFVVAALAAPLGLVAVASPAAAAPVTIHVAGDAASVNGGAWVWGGGANHYRELQWRLFGGGSGEGIPRANFDEATFVNDGGISPLALTANVDVFFSGAVLNGYSIDEEQALLAWVRAGGVLIANPQVAGLFDTTDFLPGTPTLRSPVAQWEEQDQPEPSDPPEDPPPPPLPDTHTCQMHVPAGTCVGINGFYTKHSAPQPAAIVNGGNATVAALANGPHGLVSGIRNWHTVTTFTSLPTSAVSVANLNITCTAATTACSGNPGGGAFAYNNTISGSVLAVVPFGANAALYGSGAVVLSSDGDTFSNAYGPMQPGNYTLALNMFQWIGDHFAELAEPPVVPGDAADATGRFNAVTPTRVYDTRGGAGKLPAGGSRNIQIAGTFPTTGVTIPADATAVALNVTVTNQGGGGFLTVYPAGSGNPGTSNLNIPAPGKDIANAVAVRLTGGQITIANSNPGNPTDVIVDVTGYWSTSTGDAMTAVASPTRILDTRPGSPVGEGAVRTVQVVGTYSNGVTIPSGATGVIANVTATDGTRGGFLTVFPSGNAPDTSSVNFLANSNVPNLVFAPLAGDGTMKIRNAFGNTDVIVDVVGYFGPSGTTRLAPVTPDRVLDTRGSGKIAAGGTVSFDVRGVHGVDASAQSVLLNVTVDSPAAAGFLTVFPEGAVPDASNVNFVAGQTVPNLVLARIGADGKVRIVNSSPGASHIIADVFAWFGPGV